MKRLYVKCSSCNHVFRSGYIADSATQLIGFFYICPNCRRIVSCSPPEYLEKVDEGFKKSMKKEEIFAMPPGKRVELMGPDIFELDKEVIVKTGVFISSDRAIIRYRQATE
jgi:hypothetical protein